MRETGPICRDKALFAKDINLQIAEKAALKIKSDLGLDVVMTREQDAFVSLEERTATANAAGAENGKIKT